MKEEEEDPWKCPGSHRQAGSERWGRAKDFFAGVARRHQCEQHWDGDKLYEGSDEVLELQSQSHWLPEVSEKEEKAVSVETGDEVVGEEAEEAEDAVGPSVGLEENQALLLLLQQHP